MGRRCIPYQFVGFLWLESSARTLLKATTDDCAPTGRIKAQAHPKSFLMHETCPKYLYLRAVTTTPVWPYMQLLCLPTRKQLSFSSEETD